MTAGRQPIGGNDVTPILLAPNAYKLYQRHDEKGKSKSAKANNFSFTFW